MRRNSELEDVSSPVAEWGMTVSYYGFNMPSDHYSQAPSPSYYYCLQESHSFNMVARIRLFSYGGNNPPLYIWRQQSDFGALGCKFHVY